MCLAHDLIAVHHIAELVHSETAVGVAVKGKADIELVFTDKLLQSLNVGGAAAQVHVHAVGLIVDDVRLGAERVEHGAADHPRAAVRAVERYLAVAERAGGDAREIADVAVAAGVKVDRAADLVLHCPGNAVGIAVDVGFKLVLQRVVHLLADAVHELDAVVPVGIVARGDHHAAVKVFGARDEADAGRRCNVQKIGVRAGGRDARGERALIHVGGAARILADDDAGRAARMTVRVIPAEKTAGPEGVLGGQYLAGLAAETVGAEIFSHKRVLSKIRESRQ